MAYLVGKGQTVTISGSGAVHKNAVAEQVIMTVVYLVQFMLIHAASRLLKI